MAVVKRRGHRTRPWVDDYRELLPDGSWVRRTRWFRTQAEAKAHEEWRLKSQPTGRPALDPASTVREVAERFLATVRATARYNTYLCYQSNSTRTSSRGLGPGRCGSGAAAPSRSSSRRN